MRCQICDKNEATIHLTEITDGARSEMHICEMCAAEQGIAVKSHLPINELLGNLLASAPSEKELEGVMESTKQCPRCGFAIEQFRKEALLGCPYDYEYFEKELVPLIERAHDGRSIHAGRVSHKAPDHMRKEAELLNMRSQLEDAVKLEDYEKAAQLRDKIKHLEK